MDNSEQKKKPTFRLSEGIVLAGAPIAAYLFVFFFEKGVTSYFKIPLEFISISLVNVFILGGLLFGAFLFFFLMLEVLTMLFPKRLNPHIFRALLPLILVAVFVVIQIYFFGLAGWKYWIVLLMMFLIFSGLQFLWPLKTQKDKSTYIEKLEGQEQIEARVIGFSDIIAIRFGRNIVLLIIFIILGILLSQSIGTAQAFNQSDFLVTNTSPEMVVLRIYGDSLICAPFDRGTKEVQNSFKVIKVSDSNLLLTLEKIGPLHPVNLQVKTPPTPIITPTLQIIPSITPALTVTSTTSVSSTPTLKP